MTTIPEEPWTAITRKDKAYRRTHRTTVVRDYSIARQPYNTVCLDLDNDSPSKGTASGYSDKCGSTSGATHSAKQCNEGPAVRSYAAVASGSLSAKANTSASPPGSTCASVVSTTITKSDIINKSPSPLVDESASSTPDSPLTAMIEPLSWKLPETNDITVDTYQCSVSGSLKNKRSPDDTESNKDNAYAVDIQANSEVNEKTFSNPVVTCFELGRATLSHFMAGEGLIGEQLKSEGLKRDFKVESNPSGFTIITHDKLTQKEQSLISSFIQKAKQEVLEKPCKLNYAGHGSGHFVVFQNGSEARHIISDDDKRGVLVFSHNGLSENILRSLGCNREIIFIETTQTNVNNDYRNSWDEEYGACGNSSETRKERDFCGHVIFKSFDAANDAVRVFGHSDDFFDVKSMNDADESRISEGSTLTFTSKFPLPVEEVRLTSNHKSFNNQSQNLRKASKSPGIRISDCLCPWHWVFRDNIEVRVDVRKLVEKHGWTKNRIQGTVFWYVSQRTGLLFSTDMTTLTAATPIVSSYFINTMKNFIESVVGDYVRTGACSVYLSPLTTNQTMVMEAVFKHPEDAKSVALDSLPDKLKNSTWYAPERLRYKASPYFCRKQLCPGMYQVLREGLNILQNSLPEKIESTVSIETVERKNGETILFVKATRRDIGEKIGRVLSNIISPEELKITPDEMQILNIYSTPPCMRWISFLEDRSEVYVYIDAFRLMVRIYGSPESRVRVKREMGEWLERKLRQTTVISVDDNILYWRNITEKYGLQLEKLATDSGAEHVLLSFKTKSIIIVGDKSSVTRLKQILFSSSNENRQVVVSGDECVTCFCDITGSYLRLSFCGHVYCFPCFYMYLFISAESGQFPLRCASCDDPVLMEDVQCVLGEDNADLQWFINRSVSCMVARHSDEYSHCSSPDCSLVYACKPPRGDTKFECPACGEVTCRSCRVPYHEGEACWLYRMKNSKNEYELALLEWMREDQQNRGVCPRCGHGIEKTGGCNKLHCSRCDANICWLCMRDFPTSVDAYAHLEEVHGGFL